jgi:acyl-coenzyme A synthetase/AMP-(fatty) acid ligase
MLNPPETLVAQSLVSSFDAACNWFGDETAVTGRGGVDDVGFSELQGHSCALAAQLYHRYGVRRNDRVAMMCGSDAPAAQAATMLACSRLGSP